MVIVLGTKPADLLHRLSSVSTAGSANSSTLPHIVADRKGDHAGAMAMLVGAGTRTH